MFSCDVYECCGFSSVLQDMCSRFNDRFKSNAKMPGVTNLFLNHIYLDLLIFLPFFLNYTFLTNWKDHIVPIDIGGFSIFFNGHVNEMMQADAEDQGTRVQSLEQQRGWGWEQQWMTVFGLSGNIPQFRWTMIIFQYFPLTEMAFWGYTPCSGTPAYRFWSENTLWREVYHKWRMKTTLSASSNTLPWLEKDSYCQCLNPSFTSRKMVHIHAVAISQTLRLSTPKQIWLMFWFDDSSTEPLIFGTPQNWSVPKGWFLRLVDLADLAPNGCKTSVFWNKLG